jgi:hypothetical protein
MNNRNTGSAMANTDEYAMRMEWSLEQWLRIRRWFLLTDDLGYDYLQTTTSDSAAPSPNQIFTVMMQRRILQMLWNAFEWGVAWSLIIAFSGWYLYEYFSLRIQPRQTIIDDNTVVSVPATCLEQIRIQQTDPQYWQRLWTEMEQLFLNLQLIQQKDQPKSTVRIHDVHVDYERWIQYLRENYRARHIASLLLFKAPPSDNDDHAQIRSILKEVWPQILVLPSEPRSVSDALIQKPFEISVIIPAFQVSLEEMTHLLEYTLDHCQSPKTVQVIVAEVVPEYDNDNMMVGPLARGLTEKSDSFVLAFGQFQVVSYDGSKGRGGCLNQGALHATGRILTFLHSDTYLPHHWDVKIRKAFHQPTTTATMASTTNTTTTLCAFSMGIDFSPFQSGNVPIPVGLWGADYVLGAIRCSLCKLPYGDSVLSIPAHIFEYLGGYPDQPLMEDFELVQLLRKRAAHFFPKEQITILHDKIACSPRRWQALGVAYVILANAYCIYRYRRLNAPSEDIFEFYYGTR